MNDPLGQETLESMNLAVWYNRWLLNQFEKYLSGDILEVGSGIGNFTKELMRYGDVAAIDTNKDYISNLKSEISDLSCGLGDIEQGSYFFKQKKFDSIVCLNVIEHVEDDQKAFENLYQLLKPTGHLILIVPSNPSLYGEIDRSIGHYRRYDKEALEKQLQKIGFKIKKSRRLNLLGGLGWWFSSKIRKDRVVKKGNIKLFNLFAPIFLPLERVIEPPLGTSVFIIVSK